MTNQSIESLLSELISEVKGLREDLKPKKSKKVNAKRNKTPYSEIQAAYNELCPNLKGCEVLSYTRKAAIRKLFKSYLPTIEHWISYFAACNQDLWFNGCNPDGFIANIDTVLQEKKVVRMSEQGPRQ
jgi:hypothetical protein